MGYFDYKSEVDDEKINFFYKRNESYDPMYAIATKFTHLSQA